eukprot:PhM_4_TR11525/c0_g1_i1/m.92856/K17914/KIF13; kinesin family member 13
MDTAADSPSMDGVGGSSGGDARVKVVVRVRPMNRADQGVADSCVSVDGDVIKLDNRQGKSRQYQFDSVFHNASQVQVYNKVGQEMLVDAYQGYNTTLFAYGQTGSGKTHTILGGEDEETGGIIPRLCNDLFRIAEDAQSDDSSLVIKIQMSYLEVYNERIHDLLQPDITTPVKEFIEGRAELDELKLVEDAKRNTIVKDLSWHTVMTFGRVHKLIQQGALYRKRDATRMNECSSRSHAVLTFLVTQQHESGSGKRDKISRITIVDLAGSERQSKTGVEDAKKAREMEHINLSLLTLGRCLNVCATGGTGRHIPVRDSVLTRLLSDVFGGNSKTMMIANVSPSLYNVAETFSTLDYANSAKKIVVRARINQVARALEIKELKEQIKAAHTMHTIEMDKVRTQLQHLAQENEALTLLVSERDEEIVQLRRRLEDRDAQISALTQDLSRARTSPVSMAAPATAATPSRASANSTTAGTAAGGARGGVVPSLDMAVVHGARKGAGVPSTLTPGMSLSGGADADDMTDYTDVEERSERMSGVGRMSADASTPYTTRNTGRMTPRVATARTASTKELRNTLSGHSAPVYCCAISPNGERVVSGSRDRTTRVWDVKRGVEVLCMHDHNGMVLSVDINQAGNLIVTSSDDRTVKVWDAVTGDRIRTMRGHSDKVYGARFSNSGEEVVTASCDRTLKVWQTDSGRKLVTLRGHTSAVFAAVFSAKGDQIVSVSDDRTVRLWSWKEQQCVKVLEGHAATIWGVAYAPDDQHVATASMDGTVKIWSLRLGVSLRTLRGHTAPVHDVLYIDNGTKLVSTGRDRTIRLWDAETGNNVRTMQSHTHTVYHIAACDGLVVSCSSDETLKMWDIS